MPEDCQRFAGAFVLKDSGNGCQLVAVRSLARRFPAVHRAAMLNDCQRFAGAFMLKDSGNGCQLVAGAVSCLKIPSGSPCGHAE